jgi:hypothetical protein
MILYPAWHWHWIYEGPRTSRQCLCQFTLLCPAWQWHVDAWGNLFWTANAFCATQVDALTASILLWYRYMFAIFLFIPKPLALHEIGQQYSLFSWLCLPPSSCSSSWAAVTGSLQNCQPGNALVITVRTCTHHPSLEFFLQEKKQHPSRII